MSGGIDFVTSIDLADAFGSICHGDILRSLNARVERLEVKALVDIAGEAVEIAKGRRQGAPESTTMWFVWPKQGFEATWDCQLARSLRRAVDGVLTCVTRVLHDPCALWSLGSVDGVPRHTMGRARLMA